MRLNKEEIEDCMINIRGIDQIIGTNKYKELQDRLDCMINAGIPTKDQHEKILAEHIRAMKVDKAITDWKQDVRWCN